ncbi:AbrB/MazE/SpoVT family DNA-binding domain-containing protein [Planctomicrobium piriforme]|uniref:Putative addiction module antidote n=1 Tax=Planctomicrobium piriforme TaxID=1576369 RepID=A0A1I3TFS3_9PLAN|nr:AbrB/MazE/SpoVT family DNA-binding domain-containing protein [Planctomicrobium piriforme]SFJ70018.1 putative addiction module antidote [Planctomicrobium piriforme]
MVREIVLRQAGGSITATLPKEMADRLNLAAGDRVFAIETPQGVLLTPYDPEFDAAMQAFSDVRKQYRNTLRKLGE